MERAYDVLNNVMRKWNYAPRSGVTGSYNCRPITGGTSYSLHAYRDNGTFVFWTGVKVTMALAVDINWDKNPYGPRLVTDMPRGMVDEILALRTNTGKQVWGWGGYYSTNKDAMHFEIVCSPADLASGIRQAPTTPSTQPSNPADLEDDDDMPATIVYLKGPDNGVHAYMFQNRFGVHMQTQKAIDLAKFLGTKELGSWTAPAGDEWKDGVAVLDGPCQNFRLQRVEDWGNWLSALVIGETKDIDPAALAAAIAPLINQGASAEKIAAAVIDGLVKDLSD